MYEIVPRVGQTIETPAHTYMYVCMYGMLGISGESPHYNNAKRSGTVKRPKKKWYFKCLIIPGSAEIKYGKSC